MKGWANKMRATVAAFAAATLAASLMPAAALAYAAQPEMRSATANETSSSWDEYFDAVDEAEAALLSTEWVSAPGEVTSATTFWIWLDAKIESLGLSKVRIHIDEKSLEWVAPIDGTAANPAGTDGYFSVKISVYRSWFDALVARRVPINGVLKAAPYEEAVEEPSVPIVPVEPVEPIEPEQPEKPVQPGQPTDPDEGDDDQKQPTNPGDGPVTPPADDEPDTPTPPDTNPAPYVPADKKEAAGIMKELILQQNAADKDAWTLGNTDDAEHNEMYADEASAKKAVLASVRTMLEERGIVPAGYTYQLGDPDVTLPTEEAEGTYSCPVYLTKVDATEGDASAPAEDGAEVAAEVVVLEARGLSMHPLHATQAATNVKASQGSIVTFPIDERPDLTIDGLISRLKPQNVNRPVQVVPGDSNGGANQPSSHPLANEQNSGSIKDANSSNSDDDNGSDGTEREIKRPQQLSDDKRNTPDVKTTVRSGSSIASTHDSMMGGTALLGSIGAIAAVVAVVCLLLTRRRHD